MKPLSLKIRILFLFSIFIMYWAGCTLFIHKHTVDGVTIVHSHPFTEKSHHHKVSDLRWIDMLSHVLVDDECCAHISVEAPEFIYRLQTEKADCAVHAFNAGHVISLRAPPVLS